jgi:two-component system sensor histidine kinase KdpD
MARGVLRVYLGAAPGVGKTYAMLGEGHRRLGRGTDVVVGYVETHGRQLTARMVDGLDIVPRRTIQHRGRTFTEMDVDAVLTRRPAVALVDELAHTNVPGSRNPKRWQDVESLLEAGIDVITTVNIQHLESLNDVVEAITGVRQQETVPDEVVRRADQIELVDMSPQALRRRMAHGNVYAPEKVDAALTNYFRVGNLTALRELALLWVADRVDAALESYRATHDISEPWPARERVVVALSGGPEGDVLVRRGARIAERGIGGELLAVHVTRSDGLSGAAPDTLARQRRLVESLGGTWHLVVGDDVASAILDFARGVNATQIVLGAPRRGPVASVFAPGPGPTVVRDSGDIDVHIVTHQRHAHAPADVRMRSALSGRRIRIGWLLAVVGPPLLGLGLHLTRDLHGLSVVLLSFLGLIVAVSIIGGMGPALLAAVTAGLLANYLFTPPEFTWSISNAEDGFSIVVFVGVAVAVSAVVDLAARRAVEAARARAEADTLSTLAGTVLRGGAAVPALLERLREAFQLDAVGLRRHGDDGTWVDVDVARAPVADHGRPDGGRMSSAAVETVLPVHDEHRLVLIGRPITAAQTRVATVVAEHLQALVERDVLRATARAARAERERTTVRTALLAAVSHDLRTPLAGIKAAASSLRATDVQLDANDQQALLSEIESSADRLQTLVDNLLDLSRLDAGVVQPQLSLVALDDVVAAALRGIPAGRVRLDIPDTLPLVHADAGLLERAIANIVENAERYAPADQPVVVNAAAVGEQLVLRIADRGPGVPDRRKAEIFRAFQRLGDAPAGSGLGLGLAVARGFVEANRGTLDAEDTPGGGLTVVLSLPLAEVPPTPPSPPRLQTSPSAASRLGEGRAVS